MLKKLSAFQLIADVSGLDPEEITPGKKIVADLGID